MSVKGPALDCYLLIILVLGVNLTIVALEMKGGRLDCSLYSNCQREGDIHRLLKGLNVEQLFIAAGCLHYVNQSEADNELIT
jgi:hypothetical protein